MFYSNENLKFTLNDVLHVEQLCEKAYFGLHTAKSFYMIIEPADALSTNHLRPILIEMDRNPPFIENSRIKVHPKMRALMLMFGEGGWISMSAPFEHGVQQVPFTILQSTRLNPSINSKNFYNDYSIM